MEEEKSSCSPCISGKMSTLSITPSTTMIPEESTTTKFVGEEAIGKKIRIFDEGCVVSINNGVFMYLFERDDDGRLEPIYLKDQMMELGIVEKEEDMIGKKIRVYDEGSVVSYYCHEKLGMHTVKLDDGRLRELVLDDDEEKYNIEWEHEWHLRKSDQLATLKRIRIPITRMPFSNEDILNEDRRRFRSDRQQRSFDYIN